MGRVLNGEAGALWMVSDTRPLTGTPRYLKASVVSVVLVVSVVTGQRSKVTRAHPLGAIVPTYV